MGIWLRDYADLAAVVSCLVIPTTFMATTQWELTTAFGLPARAVWWPWQGRSLLVDVGVAVVVLVAVVVAVVVIDFE